MSLGVVLPAPRGLDCTDAVVLVAAGPLDGLPVLDDPFDDALPARGMTVVAFDARGRGESAGQ